jgi:oligopeptidase A
MDLFARANKRSGAWMDECASRRRLLNEQIQLPTAFLNCNFAAPTKEIPALLTHDDVITLFHECGHCLHHLLTKVDYLDVSGINGVEWDAVELPSQFFENWCWEKEGLDLISGHYQNGETLPQEMINQLIAARNFQSAMQLLRQVEFSLFDFYLHHQRSPKNPGDIQQLLDQLRHRISVVPVPSFNRFQHSFSHIFAGGYAAGYYSYKWAEVLAADAFSKFEKEGIFNPKTGREFLHHILEKGGSQDAMDLFIAFRGRKPTIDALLKQSGIMG